MRRLLVSGFLLALVLAGVVSYWASASPDGLNKVAEDKGFAATAEDHPLQDSPLADYEVRGVSDGRLAGGLAGVLGVVVTFALGGVVFLAVRGKGGSRPGGPDGPAGPDAGGAGRAGATGAPTGAGPDRGSGPPGSPAPR